MQVNSDIALERGRELREKFGSWAKVAQAQREIDQRRTLVQHGSQRKA